MQNHATHPFGLGEGDGDRKVSRRMREEMQALVETLKVMRAEGVQSIYLQDDTLEILRKLAADSVERAPVAASAAPPPNPPRSRAESRQLQERAPEPERPREMSLPIVTASPTTRPRPRPAAAPPPVSLPEPPLVELPPGDKATRWKWLRERVLGCAVCRSQVKPGKQVVFGVGTLDAEIFFCGEAPGAEEEVQGEPFVGPAGELLTKILLAMRLKREDVYIGNIMNWRPPMPTPVGNRAPTPEEMDFCLPYLRAQLKIVAPKVIVALGQTAVTGLLGRSEDRKMKDIHGQWFSFEGIPLLPTYHPSYLLRSDSLRSKRMVWEDMMQVMEKLGMPISDRERRYFLKKT